MRVVPMGVALAVLTGCQRYVPPPRVEKPAVVLSMEYPNAARGGLPAGAVIRVRNGFAGRIKAVREFAQARAGFHYEYAVTDAGGRAGELNFSPGAFSQAHDIQPGRLSFIEYHIRFDGLPDPVMLVAAFGYAAARKD